RPPKIGVRSPFRRRNDYRRSRRTTHKRRNDRSADLGETEASAARGRRRDGRSRAGTFPVVCVDEVRDRQDLLDRVRRAPGIKVRGHVSIAWVRFRQHNDEDELAVDEDALQEYKRMGCVAQVPEALLRSAIGPTDPEVAGVLRSTLLNDRTGAAGVWPLQETLQGNTAGEMLHGSGTYASPSDTGVLPSC
ncbi:hypothetical protein Vretimale_7157, partial [Volvox reticuliferus]